MLRLFAFATFASLASADLFISEVAAGTSNNKYFEIYNPTSGTVSLNGYGFPQVSNQPSIIGSYEYWNLFTDGATIAAGDVYVVCHPSADAAIQDECDQTFSYLSSGDDGLCLALGNEEIYTLLDCVGDFYGDAGSGWDVAGVTAATKDHTLVRKDTVTQGNGHEWADSAGTNAEDSEWIVLANVNWNNLGTHDVERSCTAKSTNEWSALGCNVENPTGTTVTSLGSVTLSEGYSSCDITCPTNNGEFTVITTIYNNCNNIKTQYARTCRASCS